MATDLDRDLEKLLVGTNDLRRRTGQAFYHFYRTLIFWSDKGLSFHESTKVWMAAGAAIFRLTANALRSHGSPSPDAALRRYVATSLTRLAEDLARGEHTRIAHVRWIETRFPALTQMMRDEAAAVPIYDVALAEALSDAFTLCAGASPRDLVALLRRTADEILAPTLA